MRKLLLSLGFSLACTFGAHATWTAFNGGQCSYRTPYDLADDACELIYVSSEGNVGYSKCAFNPAPSGDVTLPAKLDGKSLVRIGEKAFFLCTQVTSVTLPASVTEIKDSAFDRCTSLTNVALSEGLVTLGNDAFFGCSKLRSMTLPSSFRNDGGNQFRGCASGFMLYANSWEQWMSIIAKSYGNTTILSYPNDITLCLNGKEVTDLSDMPSSVRNIRSHAFAGYGRFKIDRLPSTVTNVGAYAFANCTNIVSFDFSTPGVTYGSCAFLGTKLDNVTLPDWMTATPRGLFNGCSSLKNVTLPKSLKLLDNYTFYGCSSLETVSLPETLASIGDYALTSCRLSACDIPQSVTNIGYAAFSGNRSMTRVTLPEGLRELSNGLFHYCDSLGEIDIPQGVTNIGSGCFYYCRLLKDLSMPAGVVKLGYNAFVGCSALTNVTFHGVNPSANNSVIYTGTPTNLLTTVMGYDVSWSNALAVGTWKDRPIVCIDDWPVRFDLGDKGVRTGGGELAQTVRTYGAATAPTIVCSDEDSVFSGWDRSLSDIRFFTTITAVYTPKPLAVKGSSSVSMMRFDDGASIQLTALGGVKPYAWSVVSGLPAGLSVSSSGVISGNTAALGAATVKVRVTDSRDVSTTLTYTLTVTENTNLKPVIDAASPAAASPVVGRGATNTLAVTAHDPEGQALAYRWFVDGVEESGASGASFAFVDGDDGVLTHAVRCVIEDPVWKLGYTVETNWTVRTLTEPVISPADGMIFEKGTGTVSIVCNIPEAEVFYAIDLSPRLTDRFRYTGPFTVGTSCVVRAIARSGTYLTDYVSAAFTCATPALSDPVGAGVKVQFETGGDADWIPDGDSLRSGTVEPNGESWLKAVFEGKGTFSFKWKSDCEHDIDEACSWDALEVYVDGSAERFDAIDDVSDWTEVKIPIAEKGGHTILWRFVRDDYDEDGESFQNCGWIADVRWRGSLLPELALTATAGEVSDALADAADARLKAHVTTAARYGRFRAWAIGVDAAGEGENVLSHSRAWASFALAQPTLLESDLTDGDLAVKTFAAASVGSGSFELTASVGDLTVGATADPDDLAELIGVIGSSTLDATSFSSENVTSSFSASDDGDLHLLVSPKTSSDRFFFSLRCLP